jgi:transposase
MDNSVAATAPGSKVGRPRRRDLQAILNAVIYFLRGSVTLRRLPKDSPPVFAKQRLIYISRDNGLFQTINHVQEMWACEKANREANRGGGRY